MLNFRNDFDIKKTFMKISKKNIDKFFMTFFLCAIVGNIKPVKNHLKLSDFNFFFRVEKSIKMASAINFYSGLHFTFISLSHIKKNCNNSCKSEKQVSTKSYSSHVEENFPPQQSCQ